MVIAIDNTEQFEYVLKEDRKSERPTVFLLAVLDGVTLGRIEDGNLSISRKVGGRPEDKASISVPVNGYQRDVVRFGLRGWRDFQDRKGQEIPFETVSTGLFGMAPQQLIAPQLLGKFKKAWIGEIAEALIEGNKLTEEEEKNSEAPSPLSDSSSSIAEEVQEQARKS